MEMRGYKSFGERMGIADFLWAFLLGGHVSSAPTEVRGTLCSPEIKVTPHIPFEMGFMTY
jgi:hypothetical protein